MVAAAVGIVVVSTMGAAPAFGAGGGTTTDTFPVSFVMSSASCANLPAGTTVNGTGVETSITTIRTARDGVTTVKNSTHAYGTAIDQSGNAYVFDYLNKFRVSNTVAVPGIYSGRMLDSFSLLSSVEPEESEREGGGPAKLRNGFLAIFTTDFGAFFSFQPIHSHGDPIDFTNGSAHCDPL